MLDTGSLPRRSVEAVIPFPTPKEGLQLKAHFHRIHVFRLICSVALLVPAIVCVVEAEPTGDDTRRIMDAAMDAMTPALVRIHVVSGEHYQGREIKIETFGSGAVITKDGCVITNHHVAGRAKHLTCTMADKTEIDAELVGTDALADIAVIKLKPTDKRTFSPAKFGDSSKLRVGDRVLAMGSPLSFSQSVTMGIISNTELIMPRMFGQFQLDGEDVGTIVRWIAHDADIYPGNSGGPLVNMKGEIVGINEISLGLSGAIPGNLAREVADQLIRNRKVTRSWLGISVQPLLKSMETKSGVLIGGTIEGSPAREAGFLPGDILVHLAGKDISVRFDEEMPGFNHFVMGLPRDKTIEAVVLRGGSKTKLRIQPEDKGEAKAKEHEFKEWGICGSDVTRLTAIDMKRDSTDGVLVTSLGPGGPAASSKPAIIDGDVIVEVAGKPVRNVQELRKATAEALAGKDASVPTLVTFERHDGRFLTVVKLGIRDTPDPGLEVRKAWLPATVQVLTQDIAKALSIADRTGVRVTRVYSDSTAEKAGLKAGDIVVSLDGIQIPASQPEHADVFPAMIRQYKIGSTAELVILRDGKEQKLSVELVESPKLPREMKKYRDENFDFTVREIGFLDRTDEKWSQSQAGVLVESVGEGGWASLGDLSVGDLIVTVDDQPVRDVVGFEEQMKSIALKKPKAVVLLVKRGVQHAFIELDTSWSPD